VSAGWPGQLEIESEPGQATRIGQACPPFDAAPSPQATDGSEEFKLSKIHTDG